MEWPPGARIRCVRAEDNQWIKVGQIYTLKSTSEGSWGDNNSYVKLNEYEDHHNYMKDRFVLVLETELDCAIYGVPYEPK